MGRFISGVLLASVLLYVWGFIYWGMGPYQKLIWKPAVGGEGAAAEALRQHFPENGVYFIPAKSDDPKETTRRYESGPVAFVHMLSAEGVPEFDPILMVRGFLNNLLVIVLIGLLLLQVRSALPTYFDRMKFVTLAGVTSAILIDLGAIAWWRMSIPWKLYQGIYDVSAWVVAGLVLAYFIRPATPDLAEKVGARIEAE